MDTYVVVDIETTGTKPLESDIIEIGAVYIENGEIKNTFNSLVKPTQEITPYITSITGITNEMVEKADPIEIVMPNFINFCKEAILIGHNMIVFDYRMLKVKASRLGLSFERRGIDTLIIARKLLSHLPSRKLGDLCGYYNISLVNAHRAYDDAYATYELFTHLKKDFYKENKNLFEPEEMIWEVPESVPITKKQESYLLKLLEVHNIEQKTDIKKLSKSEASRKIDQIIRQYGKSR